MHHWLWAEFQPEGAATSFSPWPTTIIIRERSGNHKRAFFLIPQDDAEVNLVMFMFEGPTSGSGSLKNKWGLRIQGLLTGKAQLAAHQRASWNIWQSHFSERSKSTTFEVGDHLFTLRFLDSCRHCWVLTQKQPEMVTEWVVLEQFITWLPASILEYYKPNILTEAIQLAKGICRLFCPPHELHQPISQTKESVAACSNLLNGTVSGTPLIKHY